MSLITPHTFPQYNIVERLSWQNTSGLPRFILNIYHCFEIQKYSDDIYIGVDLIYLTTRGKCSSRPYCWITRHP